jgi:hypothetical protein
LILILINEIDHHLSLSPIYSLTRNMKKDQSGGRPIQHFKANKFKPGVSLLFALALFSAILVSTYIRDFNRGNIPSGALSSTTSAIGKESQPVVLQNRAPFDFAQIVKTHNLATTFKPLPSQPASQQQPYPSWCTRSYNESEPTGLIYVKVEKAASSTTAGVALRIAHRVGGGTNSSNLSYTDPCDVMYDHTHRFKHMRARHNAAGTFYGKRNTEKSFLFASIRDPSKRAISRVFFENISKQHSAPSDDTIIKFLGRSKHIFSPGRGGFQLAYTALEQLKTHEAWSDKDPLVVRNATTVHRRVKHIMKSYNFMIVVERYDESLVALQLLLGLTSSDILYLPSKGSGSYSHSSIKLAIAGRRGGCQKLTKSFVSPAVKEHLESDMWYAQNYGDFVLHAAVNASLDNTIDSLGRARFNEALAQFLELKRQAADACTDTVIWPCSQTGDSQWNASLTQCYNKDEGCGYPCLDEFVASQ